MREERWRTKKAARIEEVVAFSLKVDPASEILSRARHKSLVSLTGRRSSLSLPTFRALKVLCALGNTWMVICPAPVCKIGPQFMRWFKKKKTLKYQSFEEERERERELDGSLILKLFPGKNERTWLIKLSTHDPHLRITHPIECFASTYTYVCPNISFETGAQISNL